MKKKTAPPTFFAKSTTLTEEKFGGDSASVRAGLVDKCHVRAACHTDGAGIPTIFNCAEGRTKRTATGVVFSAAVDTKPARTGPFEDPQTTLQESRGDLESACRSIAKVLDHWAVLMKTPSMDQRANKNALYESQYGS
jgi:hypothetical protein